MKPSGAKSNSPVSAPSKDSTGPAVADELRAIDTASLERLLEIRKEESQLEDYRTRAEQMKDNVQEVVWRRVVADYTKRVATLEEQATPLKAQVRVEYQKLRALFDRTKSLNDGAEIEKSELEFRHAVGELTKQLLDERLRSPAAILERCSADLSSIEEQKTRFLSAFGSEAELELPAPVAPAPQKTPEPAKVEAASVAPAKVEPAKPAPVAAAPPPKPKPEPEPDVTVFARNPLIKDPVPAPAAAAREPEPDATMMAPNPMIQTAPPPARPAAVPAEPDETMMAPNPMFKTAPPAPPPAPAPEFEPDATAMVSADQLAAMREAEKAAAGPAPNDDRTFMLAAGGLVINSEGAGPREYRLAAMNYLGRSEDSQVLIARPGVSRKHALISAGTSGYQIKDLESQNGTFVNGQRITEQALKDGDLIVIGDTKITFRTPWPAAGQRGKP